MNASVQETPATFDAREFRRALGCFPTGVAIITTRDTDGTPIGLTCNSFSSVSLYPPLVLWSLRVNSRSLGAFQRAQAFAINVLSEDQSQISAHFASSSHEKFDENVRRQAGLPAVPGCIAKFLCKTTAEYQAGDHLIFIGEVESFEYHPQDPLVFYRGAYKMIAESLANISDDAALTACHINEAREQVYGITFRLACERATEQDINRIEEKLTEIESHLMSGDMERRAVAALEFFNTIGCASHNPALSVVAHSLGSVMKKQVSASAMKTNWASLHQPQLNPIRRRIFEHIRDKNSDGALQALSDYIRLSPLQAWT